MLQAAASGVAHMSSVGKEKAGEDQEYTTEEKQKIIAQAIEYGFNK